MLEKYPQYKDVTERYFAQDYSNFCNMFIFNKKIFFEYCEWIFDIQQEGRSFLIPVLDAKTMSLLVSVMVLSFKLISDILSVFIINLI